MRYDAPLVIVELPRLKIRLANVVRSLGFLLGGFMAFVAAASLYVWVSFDAEEAADALSNYFRDQHERTLMLTEKPRLSLWPRPALSLHKVSLGEAGANHPFASATDLRVELAVMPLLHHEFELRGVSASGVSLSLRQRPTGEWNAADLLEADTNPAPPGWRGKLQKLSLKDVQVSVQPLGRSTPIELQNLEASVKLPADGTPGELKWSAALQDTLHESELNLHGRAAVVLEHALHSGSLRNIEIDVDGDSHGLRGATLKLSLATLAWHKLGKTGELKDLRLQIRGARGASALNLSTQWAALGWQGRAIEGHDLAAQIESRTVSGHDAIRLTIPGLAADAPNGGRSQDASLDWQHEEGSDSARLQARLEGRIDLLASAIELGHFSGELALQHPVLRKRQAAIGLEGSLRWQPGTLNLDSRLASGDSALSLKAGLRDSWPPSGSFTLHSEGFNLDQLLTSGPGQALPALPWLAPAGSMLDGKLDLARLRFGGLSIDSLQGPLLVRNGDIGSERLSARLHGGQLSAALQTEAANRHFMVQGDFSELSVGALADETGLPLPLEGKAAGSFRLGGLLKPGEAVLPGLEGALRWNLTQASFRGLDLIAGLHELMPAISNGNMSARSPAKDERTELGSASSRFVFGNGLASAEQFETKGEGIRLTGSGQANLREASIDFRLQANLAAPPKELLALRGKSVPLHVKGPAMQPDLRYEPPAPQKGRP